MKESSYEIGTDEVAVKLGLSSRSVRRLGEKGILEGQVEITAMHHGCNALKISAISAAERTRL